MVVVNIFSEALSSNRNVTVQIGPLGIEFKYLEKREKKEKISKCCKV